MYKVDLQNKKLKKLPSVNFSDLEVKERFDIEEWVRKNPDILKEKLLVISEQKRLPSGRQPDLLALDKNGNLVIIELKRDDSGKEVYWQAITYTANFSELSFNDIINFYTKYLESIEDENTDAKSRIEEFIEEDLEKINQKQRIILVSKKFHLDVLKAVLWLRDYEIDIRCVKLIPYKEENNQLLLDSSIIIPTPEVEDYIEKKISKQKEVRVIRASPFSLEKGNFYKKTLKEKLKETFSRESDLTSRLIVFIKILLSEDKNFNRGEIKEKLFGSGVGKNIGQTGRYLSNISQFLTKKSTPHLRQIIDFTLPKGREGEVKDNYKINPKYKELVEEVLNEIEKENNE